MDKETVVLSYDVIVVGSGGAGSAAAHAASRDGARVLVVTKDPIGCSDSKIAEGIVTVRGVAEESDSDEVLSELGYSEKDIEGLYDKGVTSRSLLGGR